MVRRSLGALVLAPALDLVPTTTLAAGEKGYLGDGVIEAGEDEAAELARAVQNPVANLISVPFQNNSNFDAEGCWRRTAEGFYSRRQKAGWKC